MAAQSGSLELCRLLLQTTSLFHDESIMRQALWHSLRRVSENPPQIEALYNLYVGEYGMELDPRAIAWGGFDPDTHILYRTEASIRMIMASQPFLLANLPPAHRFSQVVGSSGLPADMFMTQLCQSSSGNPATNTDSDGKTALHWAAAYFGEWSFRYVYELQHLRKVSDPLDRRESYMKLASRLVAMGADVHALWQPSELDTEDPRMTRDTEVDPFVSFLAGVFAKWMHRWRLTTLSHAVASWGEMLMEGGCSLPRYIATENVSLRHLRYSIYDDDDRELRVLRLVLNEESKLALEVALVVSVPVYKLQPSYVSGAWPLTLPSHVPDTIIWGPWPSLDELEYFRWVRGQAVKITSALYRIKPLLMADWKNDLEDSFRRSRREVFDDSQDDHGILAGIITRELKAHQSRTDTKTYTHNHSRRRRAVSVPGFKTIPKDENSTHQMICASTSYSVLRTFHKCVFDSRWALHHGSFRRCMQGDTRDVLYNHIFSAEPGESRWERWLLSSEDHVPQARRHAERLCPKKLHIVETTLERATDRARMAMGPKRLEDVSGA
jgi:hypothetical protein